MNGSHPSQQPVGANVFSWVCTKNPFYAVSAALVLLGLWISFGNEDKELETWLLMGGLTGYTLLLGAAALVLVRWLKLWDDSRTVMLLVVLMFLATSVTFDHLLMVDPDRGVMFYLLGLGWSAAASELLLRSIKLRLPALYRGPYHLTLALFFLYPIFVRSLADPDQQHQEPVMWGLFGFSTAAGLAALTLVPALRRGADYVRGNGSPWPWPLFPWSLFAVLAIAVPARAVLMCWSLHQVDTNRFDRLIFGPYFLVPFGFALTVLCLEFGLTLGKSTMTRYTLLLPVALIGLVLLGHTPSDPVYRVLRVMTVSIGSHSAFDKVSEEPDPVYAKFLEMFTGRLGADPLFWTLLLAACFYAYAAIRRVPLAVEAAAAALAAMAVIGARTLSEGLTTALEPAPLLGAALILLGFGTWRRNPWNLLGGAGCLAASIALTVPVPQVDIPAMRPIVFVHLTGLAMLGLGAIFLDAAGASIRRVGAGIFLILALAGMHDWYVGENISWMVPIIYSLSIGILLGLYGHFLGDAPILIMATIILGCWVFKFGWAGYRALRGSLKGFDYLVSGLGFFMVAVLVSLGKSGMLSRWIHSRPRLPAWLRAMFGPTPALQVVPGQAGMAGELVMDSSPEAASGQEPSGQA